MNSQLAWVGTFAALLVAVVIGWALSTGSIRSFEGIPVAWVCIGFAFVVQWAGFVVAFTKRTERFFDALGSLTFLLVIWSAVALAGKTDIVSLLLAVMVSVWAVRLGTFLTRRIHRAKTDRRFNTIRDDFSVFFMTWTLQGLWVTLTLAPTLVVLTAVTSLSINGFVIVGLVLWLLGFGIEWVADAQKTAFRAQPENQEKFITTGLWSWSQHPNYFGEILLWLGIAVIALPIMSSWQYLALISPLFVYLLLTRISGVRMLDDAAKRRWGDDGGYQTYTRKTSKLILWPPKS